MNKRRLKKGSLIALAAAAPFLALLIAGFVIRSQVISMIGCMLMLCILIFLWELRIAPSWRYRKFLKDIHSGISRRTLGTLVRISSDPYLKDGVHFRDVIINIYEDQSEEGERRYLLDSMKEIPADWIGRDIVLTSHGNMVLAAEIAKVSATGA